jgi:peptide-methionine (R)-S-oxide reductase
MIFGGSNIHFVKPKGAKFFGQSKKYGCHKPKKIPDLNYMAKSNKISKTDEEWQEILTEEQYKIARKHGTEPAFSEGNYNDEKREGVYRCAGCGIELFDSSDKYDSGTGWPSFDKPIEDKAVESSLDFKLFLPRTEVHCARCDSHLGHVFNDGPESTGKRFCINGTVLNFDSVDDNMDDDLEEGYV